MVRLDTALDALVSTDAKIELVKGGFGFTEGPVWVQQGQSGYLLFTDIPGNVIWRLTPDGRTSVHLYNAGYTGPDMWRWGPISNTYAGIPIVLTPKLPGSGTITGKIVALFGDMSLAVAIGSRRDLTLTTSVHKYFDQDMIAYRIVERWDAVVHNIGSATEAGALVGLLA